MTTREGDQVGGFAVIRKKDFRRKEAKWADLGVRERNWVVGWRPFRSEVSV